MMTLPAAPQLPDYIRPNFERMPVELKQLKNWVLWVPVWTGSKWTKVPIQVSGYGASTTNPAHWNSFDAVRQAYETAEQCCSIEYREEGKPTQKVPIGGVGYVFDGQPDHDGLVYAGVDFDRAISVEGKIKSLAAARVKRLGSYFEVSVSGQGLHGIVKAKPLAGGIAHNGVELYTAGRYFTMTGRTPSTRAIVNAEQEFAALADELRNAKGVKSEYFGNFAPRPPISGVSEISAGIDTGAWFGKLSVEQQNEVVRYAASYVATHSSAFELSQHGGNYQDYLRLALAIARSGVPDAEDIFVEAASTAKDADCEQSLRNWFKNGESAQSRPNSVTVGTLFHTASQCGADFGPWKRQSPIGAALLTGATPKRSPLKGGMYKPQEAIDLLNSWYLIGATDDDVGIFRIRDDGSLVHTPREQFGIDVANIQVEVPGGRAGSKLVPGGKFWLEHPQRHRRNIVFKPAGNVEPDEHNEWQGFAVEPRKGWQKIRRLLRHIREIICRRDKAKFKYVMRWLAFVVQHPDKAPGTVLVLVSRTQGTGKSTLGKVICDMLGQHALVVDDKDRLLGRFNDRLETVVFVLAEEVLWAGDAASADKLKSRVTADTITVEAKFRKSREVPNRMHVMMTSNHEHAVALGSRDRRYVVLDVADAVAQDKSWFGPMYQDLADGGTSEFLHFLQNVKLGAWHPREILKTSEATDQLRMSADSVTQWMQACLQAGVIVGSPQGISLDLNQMHPSASLQTAYAGYCQQHRLRTVTADAFGKRLTSLFGARVRLPANHSSAGKRPWGYNVPDESKWQEKLDAWLGI
jgi:hypothetical protein